MSPPIPAVTQEIEDGGCAMGSQQRIVSYVAGLGMALSMVSIAWAASAAADDADYIYDLSNAGIGGPQEQLLEVGYSVCGKPRAASIANIAATTALAEQDAAFLYDSAVQFLCQ